MAIWLDENSKIIVQGMTGSEGTKHTRRMVASGANVVGGVTPGKAGQEVDGIPVFNNVQDAMAATGANVTVVFVPPKFAKAAVIEAVDAQIPLAVVITGGLLSSTALDLVVTPMVFWKFSRKAAEQSLAKMKSI